MTKRRVLFMLSLVLVTWVGAIHAEEMKIQDYKFTWYVGKVGAVAVEIEKTQLHLLVLLKSPGGRLASLRMRPAQTGAVAEVLLKTGEYKTRLMAMKEKDYKEVVPAGDYRVTFTKAGRDFEVKIDEPKAFSPSVLLFADQAPKVGEYLMNAEKMAELVDRKIRP